MKTRTLGLLALCLATAGAVQAQSPDATRALNLLNSLMRPAAPAALQAAPAAGRATDMLQLLQQSLDLIEEPREIEIGRQLAAVLLGS